MLKTQKSGIPSFPPTYSLLLSFIFLFIIPMWFFFFCKFKQIYMHVYIHTYGYIYKFLCHFYMQRTAKSDFALIFCIQQYILDISHTRTWRFSPLFFAVT